MDKENVDGTYFVAYKGHDINYDNIEAKLKDIIRSNFESYKYTVKVLTSSTAGINFSKIVLKAGEGNNEPNIYRDIITVSSGYDQHQLEYANDVNYGYKKLDEHRIISDLYEEYKENVFYVFYKLGETMDFSSVIYDSKTNDFIAGTVGTPNEYNKLFYGYTEFNNELMISNCYNIIDSFCKEVHKMRPNTYMKDGGIFKIYLNDKKEDDIVKEEKDLIIKDKDTADNLIKGLNQLLVQITNEAVKSKVEKNIEEYLNSDDATKKIEDFLLKELDIKAQKQILELIKSTIEKSGIEESISDALDEVFDKKIEDYTKKVQVPVVHIVKLNDTMLGQTKGEFFHEKFDDVLSLVQLDEPIMLIGPAGSGKNHLIKQVSDALGLHMYYTNNASNEFKLTGFIDAGGNYRGTEFYKAFKNGGIFFLDEIDTSDPSALIVINSALANGYMAFPHETIDRHKNFRMVAAANTWGKGADLQYVGRNILDGATLDRFDNIFFDYDRKLESALYPNKEVLYFMWAFRDAVDITKIPHIVSTRGIGKVYKKEINGISVETTLRTNVIRNLGQDDLNNILGAMNNFSIFDCGDNKYYECIKTLKLTKPINKSDDNDDDLPF